MITAVNLGSDDKLLKCPCCDSKSEMWEVRGRRIELDSHNKYYKISCTKCGMRTCQLSSKAQARKTWNRRK